MNSKIEVPCEIRELYDYLDYIEYGKIVFNFNEFSFLFDNCIEYIKKIYNYWFKKNIEYSDEKIAEYIFVKEIDKKHLREWIIYKFFAVIKTIQREYLVIKEAYESPDEQREIFNDVPYLLEELMFLKDMIFEIVVFIDDNNYYVKGQKLNYGWGKTNIINSDEIFRASKMLLKGSLHKERQGGFCAKLTSIFLIRQSIELRLKNIFGISYITNKNGEILPISWEKFLELLEDNKKDIEFPFKISILRKIYKWTNYYIHGGFAPSLWEIEWAHHILNPLFSAGRYKTLENRFGSVKIKKSFYENIATEIIKMLKNKNINIYGLGDPEALIID